MYCLSEMVHRITTHLTSWKTDESVKSVLFKAVGEKAFCAGI